MFKLAINYLYKNKKTTIISVFGMMISIILLFSLVQIGQMIIESYKNMMLASSNYDLMVSNIKHDVADELYDRYKDKYSISEFQWFGTNYDNDIIINELIGAKGNFQSVLQTDIISGTWPSKDYEIVIQESYAKEHELTVGEKIELEITGDKNTHKIKFLVSGIMTNAPAISSGSELIVTLDTATKIEKKFKLNEKVQVTDYFSISQTDYPEDELIEIRSYIFNRYGKEVYTRIKENSMKTELADDKGLYYEMRKGLWAISFFVVITMIIFVYYMMKINIQNQLKQYGIIMAVGGKIRDLRKLIGYQLIIYGILSFVFGNIGGILLNKVVGEKVIKLLIPKITEVSQVPLSMIVYIGIIEALILTVVWSLYAIKLKKKTPIELIHKKEQTLKKKRHSIKNIELNLMLNNCSRNKHNNILLVITIFLASTLVILILNGYDSLSFDIDKSIYSFANMEVDIPLGLETSSFNSENVNEIEKISTEVYKEASLSEYKVYIDGVEKSGWVIVYSDNLMEKIKNLNNFSPNTQVIISSNFINDSNKIEVKKDNGETIIVSTDAIMEYGWSNLIGNRVSSQDYMILCSEAYAKENLKFKGKWNDLIINIDKETKEKIKGILKNEQCEYFDLDNIINESNDQMRAMIVLIMYMIISIIFLSIYIISSIVKENFEYRRKEIGMLLAIGAKKRQIVRIMSGEILYLIMISQIFATCVTIPISIYIYNIMNEEMGIKILGFILGIPVVVIFSGIIIYLNVKTCLKNSAIDLLRCED